ncbi:pentapeptide repeat-containing protein [Micromonospora sp. H61]|uniref:pentapeptide repeat-containing protein n=1 Tax=Micromonospora sp. H61 TaxID=2824888 RepID=UPI001B37AB13|nr:pentapeptide repeat-containing protein [Micromonospora sp. H61]MBQ0989460.1 pentapeptide repeat-containing protein [Micromonospora sp. H61]
MVERTSKPRTYRPIHLATLVTLAVVALAVTAVAAVFMWDAAQVPASVPKSPDLAVRAAQLRVDVIRNILAVGAGAGGLIALFLGLRRQYVKERVDHADQEYKNRTAEDTKHDAVERRVTELYTKAAEQLGSDKAPVRMAALYALERMGQGNPEHRQTIVNLICAYLRMPYNPPHNPPYVRSSAGDENESSAVVEMRQQEREVRLAAQRILSGHLRYGDVGPSDPHESPDLNDESFWSHISIDLSGAVLLDFRLVRCAVNSINVDHATFYGSTTLSFLHSTGIANFSRAHFSGPAYFAGADFRSSVSFSEAQFDYRVRFDRARLGGEANFEMAKFGGATRFAGAHSDKFRFQDARAILKPTTSHFWPKGYRLVGADSASDDGLIVKE